MRSPPFNAGDAGSVPGPGRCLGERARALEPRKQDCWAHALQLPKLLSPRVSAPQEEGPPQWEAHARRRSQREACPAQPTSTNKQVSLQDPLKYTLDTYIKQLKKKQEEVENKVKNNNNKQGPVLFKPSLFKDKLCRLHALWWASNSYKVLWGENKKEKKNCESSNSPWHFTKPF